MGGAEGGGGFELGLGFRVSGLGFRISGFGFRFRASGFGFGFRLVTLKASAQVGPRV